MADNEKNLSFEDSIRRLEEIVSLMEKGDASLDDSLKLFEEGTGLISTCGDMLQKAEQRVIRLKKGADGTPQELPFDIEE